MTHYLKRAHQVGRTFGDGILPSAEELFVDKHGALLAAVAIGLDIDTVAKAAFEAQGIIAMHEEGMSFHAATFSPARALAPAIAAAVWVAFTNGYAQALEGRIASDGPRLSGYLRRELDGDETLDQEMFDWCIDGRRTAA